ncbi:uncharacterized protein LOC110462080 [Mizuhopecten yessoensis]|uniref:Uncharacterized protein n=1 Tax=Mizuhopecten yessoensis TaxID=6573 RepID=A0A210PYX7_MIZYE|nr:uncharacterized protein LOC110462080 [Mizuhopecten yessoensis]OWF41685.1 hypothetical protein KP79_PYT18601 [Mizuhopecten yessoensis]
MYGNPTCLLPRHLMDLMPIFWFLVFLFVDVTKQDRSDDMWEALTIRYRQWEKLPRTSHDAERQGYIRQNDICKTNSVNKYHGFLYKQKDDTKVLPIYDLNGWIAGIQAMIPGNMKGFNSRNESIPLPHIDVMPPIMIGDIIDGIQMYTVTAYFKHPKLICNPIARIGITLGKGLYIQMGPDPVTMYQQIAMHAKDLSPIWKPGSCIPTMGLHYFRNLSKDLPCEKIYPVFLMYDTEGKLGAFGWSFQGKPMDVSSSKISWFRMTPQTYAFTFDTRVLPACMFHEDFRIFGIHIWLQPHDSEEMTCPIVIQDPPTGSPGHKPSTINYTNGPQVPMITPQPAEENSAPSVSPSSWMLFCVTIVTVLHLRTLGGNVNPLS